MRERLRFLDTGLLLPMVVLVLMGTLPVYSAGRGTSQSGLWLKQSLWNFLGLVLMLLLVLQLQRRCCCGCCLCC